MLIACWSTKGGSGTTVVSVGLAVVLAGSTEADVVLADLAGDCPAALGLAEPEGQGLADWLSAGPEVPADALRRLEIDARPGLRLLPRGGAGLAPLPRDGGERLAAALHGPRSAVVDCGTLASGPAVALASMSTVSLLVVRPCYLALRRALAAPIRPSGVVLVQEPGRSLSRRDVEDVLDAPVRAEIPWDRAIASAVDAGVLGTRVPRGLERALRAAA